jgi:hypothetical protein
MEKIQAVAIPGSQGSHLSQLARDLRSAVSYISFYSSDSPFVIQSVQKLHQGLHRIQQEVGEVLLHLEGDRLFLNDRELPDLPNLRKFLQERNLVGAQFHPGSTALELAGWLKELTLPSAAAHDERSGSPDRPGVRPLSNDVLVEILPGTEEAAPVETLLAGTRSTPTTAGTTGSFASPAAGTVVPRPDVPTDASAQEALLSFVAEAWQFSQLQKRSVRELPSAESLSRSFDQIFNRLLERAERSSPTFSGIAQWFKAPAGEFLEKGSVQAMLPLLETAVRNGWTSVFFDPATEGLVGEALTQWGSAGRHDLLETSVIRLAEALGDDGTERRLALSHLMDARPWAADPKLVEAVLGRLVGRLASETDPADYQSALLLAWDLLEPALESGLEKEAVALLSTLHFHAEETEPEHRERTRIARHWLFERSTPRLARKLVECCFKAGRLQGLHLLGELAAPSLLAEYLSASASDKPEYFPLFKAIRDPLRSVLAERLADPIEEPEARALLPLVRVAGFDPTLSLQVCAWVARGSRGFKLDLLGLIEEVGDPAAGPALRLALFDDDTEIASLAARVIGKIGFTPGRTVLAKAAKIRQGRFHDNEGFLTAACRSLGELGGEEAVPFLEDLARKGPRFFGKPHPMPVRLAAIEALGRVQRPEAWKVLETLAQEKNESVQEVLDRIIQERSQTPS